MNSDRIQRSTGRLLPLLVVGLWAGLLSAAGQSNETVTLLAGDANALRTELDAILRRVPPPPSAAEPFREWVTLQVYLQKGRFLLSHYHPSASLIEATTKELNHAEEALQRVGSTGALPRIAGLREEGYYADNDGSYQPFLRYLPPATNASPSAPWPLVVFLHGYSPYLNIANWAQFPSNLLASAAQDGFALAAPFGRGNTDFQGIGEQDVLRVIDEMVARHPVDPRRVILVGHSMGAMGAWNIAARNPARFAGLVVIAGRADYYFWKRTTASNTPPFKRQWIDAAFAYGQLTNLTNLPVLCAHGVKDQLISIEEGRHVAAALKPIHRRLRYLEFPQGDHWIAEEFLGQADTRRWLQTVPPATGSRSPANARYPGIGRAFLQPFLFVNAGTNSAQERDPVFKERALEWYRYSQALPRIADEQKIPPSQLANYNVFLFGEPETSPLIQKVLEQAPIAITGAVFRIGTRVIPRANHGLFALFRSPWNPARLAVIQCGIPWGNRLAENHKYDFLPDYIVYSSEVDPDGSNPALCAGFYRPDGTLDPASAESSTEQR